MSSILDSTVMKIIETSEQKSTIGGQRWVEPVGFGLFAFIAGVATDNYHNKYLSKYTAIFYIFLPLAILFIPVGLKLLSTIKPQKRKKVTKRMSIKSSC